MILTEAQIDNSFARERENSCAAVIQTERQIQTKLHYRFRQRQSCEKLIAICSAHARARQRLFPFFCSKDIWRFISGAALYLRRFSECTILVFGAQHCARTHKQNR